MCSFSHGAIVAEGWDGEGGPRVPSSLERRLSLRRLSFSFIDVIVGVDRIVGATVGECSSGRPRTANFGIRGTLDSPMESKSGGGDNS